jgi:membrane-bound lytic murein transglycosylase B
MWCPPPGGWGQATAATTAPPAAQGNKPVRKPAAAGVKQKGPAARPLAARRPAATAATAPSAAAATATSGKAWGASPEVRAFASDVAARHGLPLPWVLRQLSTARRVPAVRELIMPPPVGTAKNWAAYRARFIEPQRIAAGVAFWNSAQPWLQRAEQRWGVPPEIVVGIVGVETYYGRVMGQFRIIDALSTLAFDFPPGRRDRSEFFRAELEALLLQSHQQQADPHSLKGSFAGATGLPQFMPSSVARWAVDFDHNGHIDLHSSLADVVGSVAHYLASFGWQQGMPTHHAVTAPAPGADLAALLAPDIVPSFSAEQLTQRGAVLGDSGRAHSGPLALVELHNGDAPPSHVAGTQNFYVVTRYNWSSYYAMAVIELGAAVAEARSKAR